MPGRRHSRETVRKFFRLARGVGIAVACAQAGISFQTGRRWLRLGERRAIRAAVAASPRHDARVAAMLSANPAITQVEIGRALGVSRQRAHTIVRRMRKVGRHE